MSAPLRFKYALAALESLYAYRLEQARLALAQAQRRLQAQQADLRAQRQALRRQYAHWAAAAAAGGLDPARDTVVRAALAARQSRLAAAHPQEQALSAAVEACRERVLLAYRRCDTLDRHKQGAAREFERAAARGAQRCADQAWSLRGGVHEHR